MTIGELKALGWTQDGDVWINHNLKLYKIGDRYFMDSDGQQFFSSTNLDKDRLQSLMAQALKKPR